MYGVYLLDFRFFMVKLLSEKLPVYIPDHYSLLSSHEDYVKAFEASTVTPEIAEKSVVIFWEESNRLPKKLKVSTALRRAIKTAKGLGVSEDDVPTR